MTGTWVQGLSAPRSAQAQCSTGTAMKSQMPNAFGRCSCEKSPSTRGKMAENLENSANWGVHISRFHGIIAVSPTRPTCGRDFLCRNVLYDPGWEPEQPLDRSGRRPGGDVYGQFGEDSEPFGTPPGSDIRLSARAFRDMPASHPVTADGGSNQLLHGACLALRGGCGRNRNGFAQVESETLTQPESAGGHPVAM